MPAVDAEVLDCNNDHEVDAPRCWTDIPYPVCADDVAPVFLCITEDKTCHYPCSICNTPRGRSLYCVTQEKTLCVLNCLDLFCES